MKSEHRHELKQNDLAKSLLTFQDYVREYGGRVALAIVIVILVVVLIFQRIGKAKEQATKMRDDLAYVRSQVDRLGHMAVKPSDVAEVRRTLQTIVNDASDKGLQAEALVQQGDLAWALANYPILPAAATDPTLRPERERPDLLREARDAYQKVLDSYRDYPLAVATAHFGLAAVCENEQKWDDAKAHYEAVKAMGEASGPSSKILADDRLKRLEMIRKPVLVGQVPAKHEPPAEPTLPPDHPTTGTAATTTTTSTTSIVPTRTTAPTTAKAPAPTTKPSATTKAK